MQRTLTLISFLFFVACSQDSEPVDDYDPARDGDVVGYARELMQRYAPASFFEGYAFICGFGHLFSSAVGYAAGYYSYKWAEVLAADAFAAFEEEGIFDDDVGRRFLESILEVGGSIPAAEAFVAFRGRAPSPEPLLRLSGIQQEG